MKKSRAPHYSSYARTIVSELKTLSALIRKYSLSEYQEAPNATDTFNLLSAKQIRDSQLNPQNAIKPCLAAYAYVVRVHRDIINTIEQANTQRRILKDSLTKLRDRLPQVTIPVQQKDLQESINTLDKAYKKTIEAQKELPELESRLAVFEKKLEKLTKELDHEWDNYRMKFIQQMITELQDTGYSLSEEEIADLRTQQPWPEILARFKARGITVPAKLQIDDPDFTTYFKLKAYIVIHAFLERRMLPNTPEEVTKILKNLLKS